MRPQPSYKPGDRIGGRYLVHKALAGGMGEVFLCLDLQRGNPYALKTFQRRYDALGLKESFFEEVEHWIKLEKHPNIVRCHYMQTVENRPFMFLDWVAGDESRGTSLREWLSRGKLEDKTALAFLIDILRGLKHAGEKSPGMVHRDLKPENILIGQNRIAQITDFGLATIGARTEIISEEGDETDDLRRSMSLKGGIAGTPLYMAPEQWRGEQLDARTDLYAVGCILYEMLTGGFLYPAHTLSALHEAHCHTPLPSLSKIEWASSFLNHCLAKAPRERFASIGDALNDAEGLYQAHLHEPPAQAPILEALEAFELSNRGTTLAVLGRQEEAVTDLTQAINLDPSFVLAFVERGIAFAQLGRVEEALADYANAIRLDSTSVQAYLNQGVTLLKSGRLEEALMNFANVIRLDPTSALGYSHRGAILAGLGRREEALADFIQAARLDPTLALAYFNQGLVLHELGHLEESKLKYTQSIHLDPFYAPAYGGRGNVLLALGHGEDALEDYSRAIALNPADAQMYCNRGLALDALGDREGALSDYTQAITLDPNLVSAYGEKGATLARMGRHNEAIAVYTQAISIAPSYSLAYSNRGASLAILTHYEEALADYTKAIALDSALASAYFNLGSLHANTGHPEKSLPYFEQAAALGMENALQAVAQVRQMLGESAVVDPAQQAFESFQQAGSLDQMRQAAVQHPRLMEPDFIQAIEQLIRQQVPPQSRPELLKRLDWLKTIARNP